MQLGPYVIEGEIGRGGLGVVLRARAPDGAAVAVKVLLKADRGASAARFARERRVHEELAREGGFVPLLDAGDSPQGPYLVMPFLAGGTLRDRLDRGAWPVHEVVRLGRALARALGRAHAEGVVHRDIKPENVLYDAGARPLIADLGLAKHLDADAGLRGITQTGTIAGTLGYMPPEQMLDAKHVGPAADVFALGAVLYECLTGAPAFPGASQVEVASRMLSGGFTPVAELRPDAPAPLRDVIERCLRAEPDRRFPDGAALSTALLRAEGGGQRGQRRSDAGAVARSGATSGSRTILLVAGGLALALAAVLVSRPGPPPTATQPSAPGTAPPPATGAGAGVGVGVGAVASSRPSTTERPTDAAPSALHGDGRQDGASGGAGGPGDTGDTGDTRDTEPAPTPAVDAARLGSLAAKLAGLGGLTPQRRVGSELRRFVEPLRFLAATADELLAVDAASNVRGLGAADLRERFGYRMSADAPTAFAVSTDGSVIALASRGRLIVTPGRGVVTLADVFTPSLPKDAVVTALVLGSEPPLLIFAEGHKILVVDHAARRAVTNFTAHEADVTALALEGGRLVSADASGTIACWRVGRQPADCGLERTIGTHRQRVVCLALARSGKLLASADVTGAWAQWDVATSAPLSRTLLAEAGAPLAVRFVDDDRTVWAAAERAVVSWQTDDPRRCERLNLGRPAALAAFSASGARLATADPGGFILGVTDLEQRRELPPEAGHYAPLTGAAASARGLYTIDAAGRVIMWGLDGSISPIHTVRLTAPDPAREVPSIAAALDGRAVAVDRQGAYALDATGGPSRSLDEPGVTWVTRRDDARFLAGTRSGEVLWLDPDGEVLERRPMFEGRVLQVLAAGADATLALGAEGRGFALAAFGPRVDQRWSVPRARPGALAALAGGFVALGMESGQLRVFGTSGASRTALRISQGHEGPVAWLTSSEDGRTLLSAGEDDTFAAWRVGEEGALELIERRDLVSTGDRVRSMIPLGAGRLLVGSARGLGLLCRWGE